MRSKRTLMVLVLVLSLMVTMFGVASAVTNGQPDGNRHPYVGMITFYDGEGTYLWRCSGALIAPNVVLTAGHCTDGTASAKVFFDTDLNDLDRPYTDCKSHQCIAGVPHTHPDFCIGCANGLPGFATHDSGVVVLDSRVTDKGYATLPSEGFVDTLAMRSAVDLVGYGVQEKVGTGVPPSARWTGLKMRFYAPSQLVASKDVISDEFIKLTANPAQDKGGTCFGDSGGPDLNGGTNIVLAVNSFVNSYSCTGVTYSCRVDTRDVLNWVKSFLD